ncbi:UNVERIFIED_ORG: DUF3486 family protein [Shinella sp. XGS7]|nr:phage protein Gp27 family protein [Shinella sp. XGS7]
MPLQPRLSSMPESIRAEIDRRLVSNGFGKLAELAAWLSSEGFPIGKSTLGAYSKAQRAEIEARVAASRMDQLKSANCLVECRLRVLEVAVLEPGPMDLIARAERLLAWVQGENQ